jgi:ATP-dependent helicase/nuclease subunit A
MHIEYSKGRVADWFQSGLDIRNESAILSEYGEKRPDRVILSDGKTIVIDYKTGQKMPEHIRQIKEYGKLLREMGYAGIEEYILYTENREVAEV